MLDDYAKALLAKRTVTTDNTVIWSGPEYDILWEHIGAPNEHIHVEYDVKHK
jgi:hypothetical protein